MASWIIFGSAQTGQLDKANGRNTDALGIVARCEERDREALRNSRKKFLGVF